MSAGVELIGMDKVADVVRSRVRSAWTGVGEVAITVGGKRGGHLNALIAQTQKHLGRNPWYQNQDTLAKIRKVAKDAATADKPIRDSILRQIGRLLLLGVLENVRNQKNRDGTTFRELSARYAAFKRRKFGYIHPILQATGDLLGGLRVVVTKTS